MPRMCSSLMLSLLIASSAAAVTMDWTFVGNQGNACEPQHQQGCFGGVGYAYNIGTYEVTNAQYAEFLNAKAASDPLGLFNPAMGNAVSPDYGGIARTGSDGSYSYSAIAGRENMPVNWVSFYDALRFANWMNNGQGNAGTETGAYTLLGGTPEPSNGATATRNPAATIVLTSENEWYKAAYYSAAATNYFDYPMGTNAFDPVDGCTAPTAVPNSANCDDPSSNDPLLDGDVDDLTIVGAFTGSASPYGTFDQGGNVSEWNETSFSGTARGIRGGSFAGQFGLDSFSRSLGNPSGENQILGFRLTMIPEPGTGLLVVAGLLCFGVRGRVRA